MKIKSVLFHLASVYATLVLHSAPALATDDWNYWGSVQFEHKIDPRVRLIWNPVWRVRDDISETYYLATRQGIGYKASDSLDLAVHYFYAEEKSSRGEWIDENRLELQPTFRWELKGFNFSDRNRLEYRDVGDDEKWRYRNQLKISKAVEIHGFKFAPYISNEVFYDFKKDEFNQNRASIGFLRKLSSSVSLDVYYMVRSDYSSDHWNSVNIIGTSFNVAF